jgi:protein ImuB
MALDFEQRPLWLLDNPQRLEIRQQQLYRQGYLRLLVGPERIESGWWDKDVQRDYFIAENTQGQRYWIFREIGGEGKWYVHGIF